MTKDEKVQMVATAMNMEVRDVWDAWNALERYFTTRTPESFTRAMDALKEAAERPLKPSEREVVTPTGMNVTIKSMDAVTEPEGLFCGVCGRPMVEGVDPFFKVGLDPKIRALLEEQEKLNCQEIERGTGQRPCGVVEGEPEPDHPRSVWECHVCGATLDDAGVKPPEDAGVWTPTLNSPWFFVNGQWWHSHGEKGGGCPARVIDVKLKEDALTEAECDHDWTHDGDGALYCSKCKVLDPYSNEKEALDSVQGGQTYPCEAFIPTHLSRCSTCEWFPGGLPDGRVHCLCGAFTEEQWKEKEGDTDDSPKP